MRLSLLLPLTFVVAVPLGLAGCGSETNGGSGSGDSDCYDYSSFNKTTPTVSFKTDVLPIFRTSCGLSGACHGSESGPTTQPYLGPPLADGTASDANIKAIFTANVNEDAAEAPEMKLVKPSDPENSYLMHKVDHTLSCSVVTCEGTACGGTMPLGSPKLDQDKRDTIRRWIAQGAQNN